MNNYDQILNNSVFSSKTVDGTNTTILLSSGYIIKFSKITIYEKNRNSSKIIYMHGPYEYSIEYFEAEDHRENQYLTGPKSVEIIKSIIEDANARNLDIMASGIIRGDIAHRRKNVHIDDVNASNDITERERKRAINQGRRSTDHEEKENS